MNAAEQQAKANTPQNIDTIVFFDEANTTDAIGLIKEIMCDRRIHGRPVSADLKFIAACNPYRRYRGLSTYHYTNLTVVCESVSS